MCKSLKPVLITTGEKLKVETDFAMQGMLGIGVTRQFSSDAFFTEAKKRLYRSVVLIFPNGSKYQYSIEDAYDWNGFEALYDSRESVAAGQLKYRSTGWTLEVDKKIYEYSTSGRIKKVTDRESGNTWTYLQLSSTVTKITTAGGQWIQLTRGANGRVTQVVDPTGSTWTYEYNAAGMLTKVTSPSASPIVREYHYENTSATNAAALLTGISVNGTRYSQYIYNQDNTVQESGLADGSDVDRFAYGPASTTVTTSAGLSTTYTYETIFGEKKVTSVSRAGTSTCAGAAAQK